MKRDSLLTPLVTAYGSHCRHPGHWRVVDAAVKLLRLSATGDREVIRGGLRWWLDPQDLQQANLFWAGGMDRWEIFHLLRHLRGDWTFLDVGANFGYYSIKLAAASARGRVIAIEPQEAILAKLRKHIVINGLESRIEALPVALSDESGRAGLATCEGNSGKATLDPEGDTFDQVPLDNLVRQLHLNRIDAIKMDIEGFEPKALRGAAETLARFSPALCLEINPFALHRQKESAKALGGWLRDQGYELFRIDRSRLSPLAAFSDTAEPINAICLKAREQNRGIAS